MVKMRKMLALILTLVFAMSVCSAMSVTAFAAGSSVKLPYTQFTVSKGGSVSLKPEVKGVKSYKLTWKSSDSSVVKVSSNGKVTGVKNGSATVTVTVKGTQTSDSVKVYVGKKITSVSVDKTSISLKKGDTYKIKASVKPADAAFRAVSYSSSNKSVATVSSKGVITAKKAGTAKITVKAADGSGKKTVITVKVTAASSSSKSDKTAASVQTVKPSGNVTGGFNTKLTPMQIVSKMNVGWNLGNSLDCSGDWIKGGPSAHETAWGNPQTTEKMILDIKKMGFNTIRIPVTWSGNADADGNINAAWLKRVKEVVDYAYDNDMYVILNSHHDNSYYDVGGCVKSDDTYKKSIKKMTNVWTQIANTFKDYDERLIFETLNEPRVEGSAKEWSGGTAPEREVVAGLNKAIVKAIRETGGNNSYRCIMVPAYAATSSTSILRQLDLPDDDRIIVSVHAYSPYNFAMNANGSAKFTDSDKKELTRFFKDLNDIFVSKGTPVIIGEFGATNKKNTDDRVAWSEYYVKGAGEYNIPCIVWDNNSKNNSGGECFGLYNRDTREWVFPEVAEAMVKAAK